MQIVIDIDEEIYKAKQHLVVNQNRMIDEVDIAIANGTPLPKGHGRLIDADALEQEIISGIKSGNYEEGYEKFPHINSVDDCVECVRYSDTIIEADKEVRDADNN